MESASSVGVPIEIASAFFEASLPRVQAGRDTWLLGGAFGEIVIQRGIMKRLPAGAFEPGHVLGVFYSLQKFFILLDGYDDGDGFALACHDFEFWHGCFHYLCPAAWAEHTSTEGIEQALGREKGVKMLAQRR